MNLNHKLYLSRTWKLFSGIVILFIGYQLLSHELLSRNYAEALVQVDHPAYTVGIGSLRLEVNHYPATYVDDSIQFQSTFLVGEIRSYTEDWDGIKSFYARKTLDAGRSNILSLWVLPLELNRDGEKTWLNFPGNFSYDPFQADILKELQDSHYPKKIAQNLSLAERNLYLVYVMVDP